ncbi:MAG: aldo/keto reductase [Chloroflexota bacterium]
MEKVIMGNTGVEVTRLCFGTLTMSPLQAGIPVEEGTPLIRAALEHGVRFIDTAQSYRSYPYIAPALRGYGEEVVIVSKSGKAGYDEMKDAVEECRRALDRDVIQFFLLHNCNSEAELERRRPALEYLLEAKSRGIIRAAGISTHTAHMVEVALDRPELEIVMPIINQKNIGVLDGDRYDMLDLVRRAHAAGKGVYAMKPLAGGHLYDNAEEPLRWVIERPEVHSIALGMRRLAELEYNLAVFEGRPLTAELRAAVKQHCKQIFVSAFCEGCGRCVKACANEAMAIVGGKAQCDHGKCILCGYCRAACPKFAIRLL